MGTSIFNVAAALHALGGQAGFRIVTKVIGHGGAGGAAVAHEILYGAAVGGLVLHGFQLFGGGGQVEVGHVYGAAFDVKGHKQGFPLAGSGGFGGIQMLVSFVDLNVVNGTDLYLAVVVGILDNFGLLAAVVGVCNGIVAVGLHARAGAYGQRHYKHEHKSNNLLHCFSSPCEKIFIYRHSLPYKP